jgi:hypothetical protein
MKANAPSEILRYLPRPPRSPFFFYGSVSYWFGMLSDDELDSAFMSISAAGFRVVRTWAFNDVIQVPSSGAYFQVRNLSCPF